MTTPKHLYCTFDGMAQFALKIEIAPHEPAAYVEIKNRMNLLQPDPNSREVRFYDLGIFNDETMEIEKYAAPKLIGDLSQSYNKLDALAAQYKKEGEKQDVSA